MSAGTWHEAASRFDPRRWLDDHPWVRFGARRLTTLCLGLAAVVIGTFLMVHLAPGDPAARIAGINASPEYIEQLRQGLGLDRPMPEQFVDYVGGLASGDLGTSFASDQPVRSIIAERLPATAKLAASAFVVVMVAAIPLGLLVGALTRGRRRQRLDVLFTAGTGATAAMPGFLLATYLIYVFGVTLGWLPVAGLDGGWQSYVLPVLAIALGPAAGLARIVRVQTLAVLGQDYIRTARSKRMGALRLYLRHALPNLLTASVTVGGLLLTGLLGGSVVVENVFAWPGLGTAVVRAIEGRDYPVIQSVILVLGAIVLIVNTLLDLVLALLDPRSTLRDE